MFERQAFLGGASDEWKELEIVLDVPENALEIGIGINLGSQGQVWFDDLQLEVVGDDVPVAQGEAAWQAEQERIQARLAREGTQPLNMDFEAR